jgi:HTH-type transcriptional regulator/antitoxin HigA
MEIKVIKTQQELEAALAEIEQLIDQNPQAGTNEAEYLELLALLVQQYESKAFPIPLPDPVEAIEFRMEQQNLTQRDLVPYIGSRSKVSEVLSRKRPLSLSMVRAISEGLGIPAKLLLQEVDLLENNVEVVWEKFPLREMIKRGYINARPSEARTKGDTLLREFFASAGLQLDMVALMPKKTTYVRSARPMDRYALAAWATRVIIANQKNPPSVEFKPGIVNLDFMREVAQLSQPDNGPTLAIQFLREHGIPVVLEPHLPRTYLDGAAILSDSGRPIIGLTLRQDRMDNFWFCLEHELAHVSRHLGSETKGFYDDLDVGNQNDPREKEADGMAGEALIPEVAWKNSPASGLRSPEAAQDLADQLHIHPAIVAGRIRHHFKSYRELKELVGHGQVRKLFPGIKWED